MAVFYYNTDKKLQDIFAEHCNLSTEQYSEIRKRLIYLVAGIQDGYEQEAERQEADELGTIFDFLLHTKEITDEEYNALENMMSELWEQAEQFYEEMPGCGKKADEE